MLITERLQPRVKIRSTKLGQAVSGILFGCFLLSLSVIKRSQVISNPRSTQFWKGFLGFSSILKFTFFGTPCIFYTDHHHHHDGQEPVQQVAPQHCCAQVLPPERPQLAAVEDYDH